MEFNFIHFIEKIPNQYGQYRMIGINQKDIKSIDNFLATNENYVFCPDEFIDIYESKEVSGFINMVVEDKKIIEMTVNEEAYNAYILEHPIKDISSLLLNPNLRALLQGVNSI